MTKQTNNNFLLTQKKFDELKKKIEREQIGQKIPIGHTYKLWAESSGKCFDCGKKLLEIIPDNEIPSNIRNIGVRAHIISRNSIKYRPRIYKLYDKDLLKKLGINNIEKNKKNDGLILEKSINQFNNIILLCKEDHDKYDKPITNIEDHNKIAKKMQELRSKNKEIEPSSPNNFVLSISSPSSIETTKEILEHKVKKLNEQNKSLKLNMIFFAIDETQKYSNVENASDQPTQEYQKERELINQINDECYEMNIANFEKKIDEIFKYINQYFDKNKKYHIKMFEFRFDYAKNIGIEIKLSTKKLNSLIDKNITHDELRKTILGKYPFLEEIKKSKNKNKWILNLPIPLEKMKKRKDYIRLENLLIQSILEFSNNKNNKYMNSFSIAYMARWGTGKTTLIRSIAKNMQEFYRYIEINLWHISNTISNITQSKDNPFIRFIVKEILTQMSGNPSIVQNYLDSTKYRNIKESNVDLSKKIIDIALSLPTNEKTIDIIQERNKLIDQFLHTLSTFINRLFDGSKKPIIIVFDDIDRISDKKNIIKILDALVVFLNIKNCVFIIPIDESIVIKALNVSKKTNNPNSFINKYFTYQIKAPFIPKLERKSIFEEVLQEFESDFFGDKYQEYAANLVNPTYRDIKNFINNTNTNIRLFSDSIINEEITNKRNQDKAKLMVGATILQQKFPLYVDFLAEDFARLSVLKFKLKEKIFDTIKYCILNKNSEENDKKDFEKENDEWGKAITIHDLEFWKAILSDDIDSQHISSFFNFFNRFKGSNEKKEEWRYKLLQISKNLIEIDSTIGISNMDFLELLSFWSIITQTNFKNNKILDFINSALFHNALIQHNIENFKIALKSVETIKEINDYFKNIDNIKNENFILNDDYHNAFKNASRWIKEIDTFKPKKNKNEKIKDNVFLTLFNKNLNTAYLTDEEEHGFIEYIIGNSKIKFKKLEKPKESEINNPNYWTRIINIVNIIIFCKNDKDLDRYKNIVKNLVNDLEPEPMEELVQSIFSKFQNVLNLLKTLNIYQVVLFDHIHDYCNMEKEKNINNQFISKIPSSDFLNVKHVNKLMFDEEKIKDKLKELKNGKKYYVKDSKIIPKQEYVDLYFDYYENQKSLVSKLNMEQIMSLTKAQECIATNIRYFLKKDSEFYYKIISKNEHLLKLLEKRIIKDKKEIKDFNFKNIKNLKFQQFYIDNFKIQNDKDLMQGVKINTNALSLNSNLHLENEQEPWVFDSEKFQNKESKDKLANYLKIHWENIKSWPLAKQMTTFLYETSKYEEMYNVEVLQDEDISNHFDHLDISYFEDTNFKYLYEDTNTKFDEYKNKYKYMKQKYKEFNLKDKYTNLDKLIDIVKKKILTNNKLYTLSMCIKNKGSIQRKDDSIVQSSNQFYDEKIIQINSKIKEINEIIGKDINIDEFIPYPDKFFIENIDEKNQEFETLKKIEKKIDKWLKKNRIVHKEI